MSSSIPNSNEAQPKPFAFRPEGEGLELKHLPTSYSAVYYGFNCRPRQIKYYKIEKSVEHILEGHTSRSVAVKFLEAVKAKMEKAKAAMEEADRAYEAVPNSPYNKPYKARLLRKSEDQYHKRHTFEKAANEVEALLQANA